MKKVINWMKGNKLAVGLLVLVVVLMVKDELMFGLKMAPMLPMMAPSYEAEVDYYEDEAVSSSLGMRGTSMSKMAMPAAEAPPTFTPTATFTNTPTPTPTPAPCSNVDLNGRYVDYRVWNNALYGFVMDVVQDGCEITASEFFYLKWKGPGSSSKPVELTGTIKDDKVEVCYTSPSVYCFNLVIFGRGKTLANGIIGIQFDKVEED